MTLKLTVILSGLGLLVTGCSIPCYDVAVYLSPKFKDAQHFYPSLEVDVVGLNPNEEDRFSSYPIDDYFAIGNTLRSSTEHFTITFSESNSLPKSLPHTATIWEIFDRKQADQLYLLVNLPTETGGNTQKDPRKICIPLERPGLFGAATKHFEITPAGILPLTKRPVDYPEAQVITPTEEDNNEI